MKLTNDLLLPELTAYTADEWEEVSQKSSAVGLYRSWLEKSTENDPLSEIRLFRHRAWLRSALATYFEREPTEKICQFWSWTADQALARAWSFSGLHELPVALLAMGKLGSQELNLSSDIDLMLISDSGGAAPIEASLKIFRSFLAKNTHFGFCFRLDFDLRPGGRMGPLVSSLRQAEDYYWSLGETWERLALVRTRIVQGPEALCSAINEVFQRFCFRRYIDYGLLDDLKQLRARIHHHYQSSRNSQFNLKLGVGGIRDIELFIHALQVIHGGRDQEFRTRSTSEALRHLLERAILPQEEVEFLYSGYWRFRHLEHMIQLGADTQTHSIDFSNLPHQLRSLEEDEVRKISRRVDQIVTSLLGSASNSEKTLPSTFEKQREWLIALGFSESIVNSLWPKLMAKTALSAKREKDESARKKFLYDFVIEVTNSGVDKELGISLLYEFIQAIRAKASFFGLLSREPRLVRDLARLFSCSPYLGSILASRPELIDSFLFRFRQGFSSDLEVSLDEMAEHRLLTEIVAANQFLVDRDSLLLGQSLSACADYICMELLNRLDEREEGKRLVLVAMGKWGGFELGFRSDLDMIFVSQDLPTEKDHRIARRFVNRLNDVHKGGRIYSVDLRLRPSGQAGPLIVSQEQLEKFLMNEAVPWERQAYLRARPLAFLGLNCAEVCCARGLSDDELLQLSEIRKKLLSQSSGKGTDLKYSPGGLVDIELEMQSCLLRQRLSAKVTSTESMMESLGTKLDSQKVQLNSLFKNYCHLRQTEQMAQLAFNHSGSLVPHDSVEVHRLAKLLETNVKELHQGLALLLHENVEILKQLDPLEQGE